MNEHELQQKVQALEYRINKMKANYRKLQIALSDQQKDNKILLDRLNSKTKS